MTKGSRYRAWMLRTALPESRKWVRRWGHRLGPWRRAGKYKRIATCKSCGEVYSAFVPADCSGIWTGCAQGIGGCITNRHRWIAKLGYDPEYNASQLAWRRQRLEDERVSRARMIFSAVDMLPVPLPPVKADGTPRVADGIDLFNLAQAAARFRRDAALLADLWRITWGYQYPEPGSPRAIEMAKTA